jgi:hypothetical protein
VHQPFDTYFQTELFAIANREIVRNELQNVKLGKFSQPGLEKMKCKFRENMNLWKHKNLLVFNNTVMGIWPGACKKCVNFRKKCKIRVKLKFHCILPASFKVIWDTAASLFFTFIAQLELLLLQKV